MENVYYAASALFIRLNISASFTGLRLYMCRIRISSMHNKSYAQDQRQTGIKHTEKTPPKQQQIIFRLWISEKVHNSTEPTHFLRIGRRRDKKLANFEE